MKNTLKRRLIMPKKHYRTCESCGEDAGLYTDEQWIDMNEVGPCCQYDGCQWDEMYFPDSEGVRTCDCEDYPCCGH